MTPTLIATPTDAALKGIVLPPMPATLMRLDRERTKADPDLYEIARIIERDIGVAAAVVKTINSPLFGLRRTIESIEQAVFLLGLEQVSNLVTALSLRESMRTTTFPSMDQFFDSAQNIALIMSTIAEELSIMAPGQAYLLGLFHDCGIPLLFQKFPAYKDVLQLANATPHRSMTAIEDEHLKTDHAQVGYLVSRSWKVSHSTCLGILYHHCTQELLTAARTKSQPDAYIANLINAVALVTMAEAISYRFRCRKESHDWEHVGPSILAHFELSDAAFEILATTVCDKLAE